MVEKNPFLVEIPIGSTSRYLQLRDNGYFRGLFYLFPGASLRLLTKVVWIAATTRLPVGKYRIPQLKPRGTPGENTLVSRAVLVLSEKLSEEKKSLRTWQNYLNLACDLRLLIRMPQYYRIHPYGQPLAHITKNMLDQIVGSENWQLYFLDRLLYEDASWILAILSILSINKDTNSSKTNGLLIHERIIDQIQKTLTGTQVSRWAINQLNEIQKLIIDNHLKIQSSKSRRRSYHSRRYTAIETPFKFNLEEENIPRRTELEFTVRRDWLIELGLAQMDAEVVCLTPKGERLKQYFHDEPNLSIEFFTKQMSIVFKMLNQDIYIKKPAESITVLEDLFNELNPGPLRIIQTLILINTAIFSNWPTYYGERNDILEALIEASKTGQTNLTLQSAQRVRYYYVKDRENLL